jgi:DNA-binding transcriptional regulator GbsR (MarR family)
MRHMNETRHALIEDFGNGYVKFGHSELMGRIVGLLLCSAEAMTVDEMSERLEVSKSPVNQIARRLEELNLIRRVWIKGDRRHFYQIADDVFLQAGVNLSRLFEENLRIAEKHLRELFKKYATANKEEKGKLRPLCERLIVMREFHMREIESYRRLIEEWKIDKKNLPTVEEYVKKMSKE